MANSIDPDQTCQVLHCLPFDLHMSHIMPYANNKGTDQPVHLRSLISAFVVRCLGSIIPLASISEILSLYLVSVTAQTSLSLPWL